jgi:acetyl esterase
MPLDPHAKRFLDMLAAAAPTRGPSPDIAERRRAFAALMRFSRPAEPVDSVADETLPGPGGPLVVRIYAPLPARPGALPGLVYFHGGGLIAGSLETHDRLCRTLANETGCRLVAVDYRLAPEHPFPAATDDGLAALQWVFAQAARLRIDPARIGIGGDSAGGALAAVVCRLAARALGPRLAFQLLICPITDFSAPTASRRAFETPLLNEAMLREDVARYLAPGVTSSDPRVSPLRAADLDGLPRTYVHTAECDPVRDEGQAYAERLAAAGVAVRHTFHAGMIHLFYGLTGVIPYARTALKEIGAEIRSALGPPPD